MQNCQINLLNNKINAIKDYSESKLHEYCKNFVGKSLNIQYISLYLLSRLATLSTAVTNEKNFSSFTFIITPSAPSQEIFDKILENCRKFLKVNIIY